jgi:hypothetical protein
MAELIALSSKSDCDEEMDALMLLHLTSKRRKSVWNSEYMEKRKNRERKIVKSPLDKAMANRS